MRAAVIVSARVPADLREQIAAGKAPRRDYLLLAERLGADLITCDGQSRFGGHVRRCTGMDWDRARDAWRRCRDADVVVTDSEHLGIPLAMLMRGARRRPAHVMITHRVTARKKVLTLKATGALAAIDRVVCYGTLQARQAAEALGLTPMRVPRILHPADHHFWQPQPVPEARLIGSAGLEYRDYESLLTAVEGLDMHVEIAAASPWSKRRDETRSRPLPENVTVHRLPSDQLRDLYARSAIVVVPVHDVDFQAGSLVMYEAMAMGKAVIASNTRSHREGDIIQHEHNGLLVPPEDPAALRAAIMRLLGDDDLRRRLGQAARATVESGLNLDRYIEEMAALVESVARERGVLPAAKPRRHLVETA